MHLENDVFINLLHQSGVMNVQIIASLEELDHTLESKTILVLLSNQNSEVENFLDRYSEACSSSIISVTDSTMISELRRILGSKNSTLGEEIQFLIVSCDYVDTYKKCAELLFNYCRDMKEASALYVITEGKCDVILFTLQH
jgi:predicted nucleic acid-binding protein